MQEEEKEFTKTELITFGKYLLSPERTKFIKDRVKGNHRVKMEKLAEVYEIDLINFKTLFKEND